MAWHLVEVHPAVTKNWFGHKNRTERGWSLQTIQLRVWRCGGCRKLAVTSDDGYPSACTWCKR